MLRAEANSISTLTPEMTALWGRWQSEQPLFASPMFSAEFAAAVGQVRDQGEVAVLSDSDGVAGFYPYCRDGDVAAPFANCLTSLQGVVTRPGVEPALADLKGPELARQCGLRAIQFDNILVAQGAFEPHHATTDDYPFMDLSNGFEAYREERRAAKSDELASALRKTRKIQREVGELQFEFNNPCRDSLDTLLQWKAQQLRARKLVNHLDQDWIGDLFHLLLDRQQGEAAQGILSTLHVKNDLIAASIGVRSRTVLQGWVTAFNRDYSKYSPGSLLIVQIAQQAESLGIESVDLGRGPEPYKKSFRSSGLPVASGIVETHTFRRVANSVYFQSRDWLKASPFGKLAKRAIDNWKWTASNVLHSKANADRRISK